MRIVLLSSERSGSNLLRLIMNSHSQISAPTAPQMTRVIAPYVHLYGDLNQAAHFKQLIQDMLSLNQIHPDPWSIRLTVDDVYERVTAPNFWHVFDVIYTLHAEHTNKPHWFSKENDLFEYAFEMLTAWQKDVRFIYLTRDGRDYACSVRKMPGGNFHYFTIAQQWKKEQVECLRVYTQLKEQGIIHLMKYEELLQEPDIALRELTTFLGIPYEATMLDFHQSKEANTIASQSDYWKNLSSPIMSQNYNKFLQEMSARDLGHFEAVAGLELEALGYERRSTKTPKPIPYWQQLLFSVHNLGLRAWHRRDLLRESGRSERTRHIQEIRRRLQTGEYVK